MTMASLDLIGSSEKFRALLDNIDMVARIDSAVLIQGETGTGKEVISRAIHEASARRKNRFVALNCAAIPSTLLESELFGCEKGAFTGAVAQTVGRFQAADRGTLFLDEIGDLPLELQPKLLRALQEKQFERLGGGHTLHVDARVIAATNQDLESMVEERKFRADSQPADDGAFETERDNATSSGMVSITLPCCLANCDDGSGGL
jgi:transcriptional regulator with GAF, ATPase, and Fis domain